MKDPEASFSGLTQAEVDVLEGNGAVRREHVCALPALKSVELGAAGCCGQGQLNPGCRYLLLLNLPTSLMVALLPEAALHVTSGLGFSSSWLKVLCQAWPVCNS